MRKIIGLWTGVAILLIGFFVWHTPLRSPVTLEEVQATFAGMEANRGEGADPAEIAAFFADDDGQPFYMLNIIDFAEFASYDDGIVREAGSATDANQRYAMALMPMLFSRGSYPIAITRRIGTMVNTLGDQFDGFQQVAVVRYRSRRDFLEMVSSDAFLAAVPHKWAALNGTVAAPSKMTIGFGLAPLIVLMLLTIGCVGTLVIQSRTR